MSEQCQWVVRCEKGSKLRDWQKKIKKVGSCFRLWTTFRSVDVDVMKLRLKQKSRMFKVKRAFLVLFLFLKGFHQGKNLFFISSKFPDIRCELLNWKCVLLKSTEKQNKLNTVWGGKHQKWNFLFTFTHCAPPSLFVDGAHSNVNKLRRVKRAGSGSLCCVQ